MHGLARPRPPGSLTCLLTLLTARASSLFRPRAFRASRIRTYIRPAGRPSRE